MEAFALILLFLGKVGIVLVLVPTITMVVEVLRDEREMARQRRERLLRREQVPVPRPRHRVARRGWGALSQDGRAA